MGLLWFFVIGAVAGWLAGTALGKQTPDLLRNVVIGVAGAFLGGGWFRNSEFGSWAWPVPS